MSSYGGGDEEEQVFVSPETPLPASMFSAGAEEQEDVFSPVTGRNGPILPEMPPEEGFALREWRRENAIRLEEKEKREKEIVQTIIQEADEFKAEFYRKWQLRRENNITSNREKEKIYVEGQEKFHAEASKNYFKAIAELIPNEVPTIEKKGKKAQDKKPNIVVIQGPKPGKPTDLSRLRHIHLKLKHNPPAHMKPPPPPTPSSEPGKDAKPSPSTPAAPSVTTPAKPVPVAD